MSGFVRIAAMNRRRVRAGLASVALVRALALAGAVLFAASCSRQPQSEAASATKGGARASASEGAALPAPDWPLFRGSPELRGTTDARLAPPLKLLWTHKTGGPVKSSAAIVGDRVFVGSNDGKLHALALADGKPLWTFATEGPIEASPLVLDGTVFFGSSDNHLYAVDATTGKLRWKYATEDRLLGAPNASGGIVVVGGYDSKVHAVDAATGKRRWVYETGNYVNGAVAISGGRVVFGGCDGLLHVLSLADGSQLREIELGAYLAGSCAVDGQSAFAGHYGSEVVCADLEKGELRWTYKPTPAEPFFSSPALDARRLYIGGRDRKLHALSRSDGKPAWTFKAKGNIDSSPLLSGDVLYCGSDDGRLYAVAASDGRMLWSYDIGKPIDASPALAHGRLIVGANDGSVYAFGPAQ